MRVRVYYNLNRAVWSIKAMEGEFKGKVIGYADSVVLSDAHTVVSEAGRQRVLRERRKNVHAYIDGQLEHVSGYQERLMTPPQKGHFAGSMWSIRALHGELSGKVIGYTRPIVRGEMRELYYSPYSVSHFVWLPSGDSTEGQILSEVCLLGDRKVQAVRSQ